MEHLFSVRVRKLHMRYYICDIILAGRFNVYLICFNSLGFRYCKESELPTIHKLFDINKVKFKVKFMLCNTSSECNKQ